VNESVDCPAAVCFGLAGFLAFGVEAADSCALSVFFLGVGGSTAGGGLGLGI
jgi:hypothetical protein